MITAVLMVIIASLFGVSPNDTDSLLMILLFIISDTLMLKDFKIYNKPK